MEEMTKLREMIDRDYLLENQIDRINEQMKVMIADEVESNECTIALFYHPEIDVYSHPPMVLTYPENQKDKDPPVAGLQIMFENPLDSRGSTLGFQLSHGLAIRALTLIREDLKKEREVLNEKILNKKSPTV